MPRLTKDTRDFILARLMKRAFRDRIIAMIEAEKAFFQEVYQDCHGKDLALLKNVPDRWTMKGSYLSVCFGADVVSIFTHGIHWGLSGDLRFCLENQDHDTTIKVPLPADYNIAFAKVYDARSSLAKRYTELSQAHAALKEEVRNAKLQASTILGTATSFKKLFELWPEIRDLVQDLVEAPAVKIALPAVQIETLNKTFELPPDNMAA